MKKNTFRILRITLLCIALILCIQLLPTSADAADLSRLEQAIIDSYTSGERVDVSGYELHKDDFHALFWQLRDSGKLPWYAQRTYRRSVNDSEIVQYFYPLALDETTYDRTLYEQKMAELLHATIHDGMSQWQKALSVHDYIITHCAYDESLTYYEGYDLLIRGTSVCNGYAEVYMDAMNRLGIPCMMVHSKDMNHVWNLVQIYGNWYHVDATWDDPTPNSYGTAKHTYFLATDAEMSAKGTEGHYNWKTDITCTDTSYTNAFWKEVDSAICYLDSTTSYLRRFDDWTGYMRKRDEKTGKETTIYTDSKKYINIGYGEYSYGHHGLSLWNGRIYFATMNAIVSCDLSGGGGRKEFTYDTAGNRKYIYGLFVENGNAYLTLKDHEGNTSPLTVPLQASSAHSHSYTVTVIAPTCMEAGFSRHQCPCGLQFTASPTPALGHNYESTEISAATTSREGQLRHTCTRCGDSYLTTTPMLTGSDPLDDLLDWLTDDDTLPLILVLGGLGLLGKLFGKKKRSAAR